MRADSVSPTRNFRLGCGTEFAPEGPAPYAHRAA